MTEPAIPDTFRVTWIAHADAGRFTEAFRALRNHLAVRARWSA